MIAIALLVIALLTLLPSCYRAALLPVIWNLQNTPTPINIVEVGPVHVMPADLVVLTLLIQFGLAMIAGRHLVADRPLYFAIGLFLAVNFLASVAAGVKFGSAHFARCLTTEARFISEIGVVPVVAWTVKTLPQARTCIRILLGTLAMLAAIQFINFFGASHGIIIGEVQGMERGEARYFGPVGDSVGFVLLLGYAVSLCSAQMLGAAAFLGGIVLTAGLGTLLATALCTVLFLVVGTQAEEVRAFVRQRLWLLPVALLAGVIGVTFFARPMAQTLIDRVSSGNYASSGGQRMASATLAAEIITDNPLLGVGYMGYQSSLAHYGGDRYFDLDHHDGATANANNQYLQALADSGIPGLLALGLLLFCAARLLWIVGRTSDDRLVRTFHLAAFIWLLTQVFGNIAAAWLIPSSCIARFLWVILGIAVAAARLAPAAARESSGAKKPRWQPLQPITT